MKKLMLLALVCLGLISCENHLILEELPKQEGIQSFGVISTYGPVTCTIDDQVGAKCGLTDWGGCYEETDCYPPSELKMYTNVLKQMILLGEYKVDSVVGRPIMNSMLTDALNQDGLPIE